MPCHGPHIEPGISRQTLSYKNHSWLYLQHFNIWGFALELNLNESWIFFIFQEIMVLLHMHTNFDIALCRSLLQNFQLNFPSYSVRFIHVVKASKYTDRTFVFSISSNLWLLSSNETFNSVISQYLKRFNKSCLLLYYHILCNNYQELLNKS